jgi:prophage regulatory protein
MQSQAIPHSSRIIRRPELESRFGLKRSTVYDHVKAGTFPAPIRIGERAVGWIESEVEAWLESRIAASRKGVSARPSKAA